MLLLSGIGGVGLVMAMSFALLTRVEQAQRSLERVNNEAALSFDLFVLEIQSDVRATSASLATTPNASEILRGLLARNRSLLDVQLIATDGTVLAQRNRVGRPQPAQRDHPLLDLDLSRDQVEIGAVGFDGQFPYLDLAVPVMNDLELPVATLLVRVALDDLWNQTINIRVGQRGYVYITDAQGQIIAFRNTRLQGPGFDLVAQLGRSPTDIAQADVNFYRGLEGGWMLAAGRSLRTVDWYVVVEQPATELLWPVLVGALVWLGAIAFVGMLVYNVLRFTQGRIVMPLTRLTEGVSNLKPGQWHLVGVMLTTDDELGALAQAFQAMALQLQSSFAALADNNVKMQVLNEALSHSEEQLRQFLEAIPVGLFVLDATGTPYYANERAQSLLGRGVVPNATVAQLPEVYRAYVIGTDRLYPIERQPIFRALRGETSQVDDLEVDDGRRRIPLEVWGTPIFNAKGEILYAIAAFQDISDRYRVEQERRQITRQLAQLNQAYERFVPEEFLQLLGKASIIDVQVGDAVEREMSVLFADICHFTSLAEQLTPEETFELINGFLSRMEPPITRHRGFVDKYIGDEIMALFPQVGADDAVQAAIAMLRQLARYNRTRKQEGQAEIEIGIGINTGSVVLGTVGGRQRMDSTVMGDTVNLASRLERLTRTYGVPLLISHHTFLKLNHQHPYHIRLIDYVQVKGKLTHVAVFEVFDADPTPLRTLKLATRPQFERGLILYQLKQWPEAAAQFRACCWQNSGDRVAEIYLERTQQRLRSE